jgi:hypothetical protein
MPSKVYDLLDELSTMDIMRTQARTKELMDELIDLLTQGETKGNFKESALDHYYPEFAKEAIRTCRKRCKTISDSLYYPVLELLFTDYGVHPDNTDDKGVKPMTYAVKQKCKPYIAYLQKKGSKDLVQKQKKQKKAPKKKTPKKKHTKKKTPTKTQKACMFRSSTGRCVNGDPQSKRCYRNSKTKRCRKTQS